MRFSATGVGYPQESDLSGFSSGHCITVAGVRSDMPEARMMRQKRKEYLTSTKEFRKTHPHTGNAVDVEAMMKD